MGGGKRTRERAFPEIFGPLQKSFWSALSWVFVQENRALTPERGGKRTVQGGVQNPFLGGVSFVRFSPPPLFSSINVPGLSLDFLAISFVLLLFPARAWANKTHTHKQLSPQFRDSPAKYRPYPQYGWDFPEEIPERPRKCSESFSWNSSREYGWDAQSHMIQGI